MGKVEHLGGGEAFCFNGTFASESYNVSSDGSATAEPSSQTLKSDYASYFVSVTPGSENLHLLNDSTVLWGSSGADLDADPNLPVIDDIDGDARDPNAPDIGADELGGPVPLPGLYRSVGITATNLNTASRTVGISGSTATFSGAMPANVGVGDVLQYQVAATWYVAFIHGRALRHRLHRQVLDGGGAPGRGGGHRGGRLPRLHVAVRLGGPEREPLPRRRRRGLRHLDRPRRRRQDV